MREWNVSVRRVIRRTLAVACVLALCCVLAAGSCDMRPSLRPIAEKVRIDREWSEIHPEPPLEVSKQVQRVSIEVPDVADWDVRPDSGSFVTPDGTPVKIEVELIAANGARFSLDSIGLGPGLTFSYLPADANPAGSRLPPDLKFKTVRLRSDAPLEAGRVSWICITNY